MPRGDFKPPKFQKTLFSAKLPGERNRELHLQSVMWASSDKYTFCLAEKYEKDGEMLFGKVMTIPPETAAQLFDYIRKKPKTLARYAAGKGEAQLAKSRK